MGVRRLSLASISNGVKYSKFWDQTTTLINFLPAAYLPSSQGGDNTNMQVFNVGPETITNFTNKLVTASGTAGGCIGNNTVAGYMQESWANGADWTKISFSTQVASFVTGGVKDGGSGVNNDGVAGYIGGGTAGGGYLNSISKMTYSNDSFGTAGSTIYTAVIQNYAWSTGSSFGYFGGGFNQSASPTGSVSKYNYSNETASGTNGINSLRLGTASSSLSKGYIFGGYNGSNSNVNGIQSWTYSNDTQSNLGATLSAARRENSSGGTYNFIYVFGGTDSVAQTVIQKFTTSTEAISTIGTSLIYTIAGGQNLAANNRGA